MNERHQYKVESVKLNPFSNAVKQDAQIQERLNRLSTEGWQFVELVVGYGSHPRLIMRK